MTDERRITIAELFEILVTDFGPFVLSNELGAIELRGGDLYVNSDGGRWIAIYERGEGSPESRSHLHLRSNRYRHARVVEKDGDTPFVGFYADAAHVDEAEPPLAAYFPSFFDWSRGKRPIPAHREFFERWVDEHGRRFELIAPDGT